MNTVCHEAGKSAILAEEAGQDLAQRIMRMPLVSDNFPFEFRGGGQIETLELAAKCEQCGKTILPENIRGTVEASKDRSYVVLTSYAICYDCCRIYEHQAKYFADGTTLTREADGSWSRSVWDQSAEIGNFRRGWFYRYTPPLVAAAIFAAWVACHI